MSRSRAFTNSTFLNGKHYRPPHGSPPTVGRRNSRRGQPIAAWAGPLPLRWADRSTPMHAQGKISAACFFRGNFLATRWHLMLRRHAYIRGHPMRTHASAVFRRRNCAAEKPDPAARQIRATRVAFSLPHESPDELMFEVCVNRGSALSAFRGFGFHLERRAACPAGRARMHRKRLNRRRNLHACMRDCSRDTAQALPSIRFSAPNFALRSRKTSSIATSSPQRAQVSPQDSACSRVVSQCALSASTDAGFCLDPIPQS
jgi:hypothetical protein